MSCDITTPKVDETDDRTQNDLKTNVGTGAEIKSKEETTDTIEKPVKDVKEVDKQKDTEDDARPSAVAGQKRKASTDQESSHETKAKKAKLFTKSKVYECYAKYALLETLMKQLDYPRPDPAGKEGKVKLYGDHFGFEKGQCKRCKRQFDTTFTLRTQCDFHMERSKRFNRRQQPHGCCGKGYGSRGCRTAPSHVYQGNHYLDLENYKTTEKRENPKEMYTVYAVDTESIHTKKGLEVCRATVVDRKLNVVYNEYCLPTTDIVDYNTIWSGITEEDFKGVTKTFEELREDMLKLFSVDTLLVGHGLKSDLMSLKIIHNKVIDTLYLYPHQRGWPLKRSLKDIALSELGMRIQEGVGHDSTEDAVVAMRLVQKKVTPMLKLIKATK